MPVDLTATGEQALKEITEKIRELREFLNMYELPTDTSRLDGWFNFLNLTKTILGNFNNEVSFVATLLAKLYLVRKHAGFTFDAAGKSQSAPGLDIDVRLPDGRRIIGEVKTVEPYKETDFGAQQQNTFQKDFAKLSKTIADYKYLFLTEPRAVDVVEARYRKHLPGVTVVCLSDGREFIA